MKNTSTKAVVVKVGLLAGVLALCGLLSAAGPRMHDDPFPSSFEETRPAGRPGKRPPARNALNKWPGPASIPRGATTSIVRFQPEGNATEEQATARSASTAAVPASEEQIRCVGICRQRRSPSSI